MNNKDFGDFENETVGRVFTWKISRVSSVLPYSADHFVRSPSFSFGRATWILKMYPCGQTEYKTLGYIDIAIERLHSEIEEHQLVFQLYFRNVFNEEFDHITKYFKFSSASLQANILQVMPNLKENSQKMLLAPNNALSIVFEIKEKVNFKNAPNLQIRSIESARSKENEKEVGELFIEYSDLKKFSWKIRHLQNFEFPSEYRSSSFSFANATWILKMLPNERVRFTIPSKFCVVLKKMRSEIPEHFVVVKICFDFGVGMDVEKSLIFNAHNTEAKVANFHIWNTVNTITFRIEIKAKNDVIALDPRMKLIQSSIGGACRSSVVLHDFKELFLSKEDSDVLIKIKEHEFSVHKIILKARSPVFAAIFRNEMKEKETGIIDIKDCDPSCFSDFLAFLYCGNINLSEENMFNLFTTADKYDVQDLKALCVEFMKKNMCIDTFCDIINFAWLYSETDLVEFATDFFTKNAPRIIVSEEWQSLLANNLTQSNMLLIKLLEPHYSLKR